MRFPHAVFRQETEHGDEGDGGTAAPPDDTSLDDVAAAHAHEPPPPRETSTEGESSTSHEQGEQFDPAIHATDDDGQPIMTTRGTYAKKRGRKPGGDKRPTSANRRSRRADTASQNRTANGAAPAPSLSEADRAVLMQSCRMIAGMEFSTARMLLGEEWQPDEGEFHMLSQAWFDYFIATGAPSMPPWVVILGAHAMVVLPRIDKPKTRSRVAAFFGWVKGRFTKKGPI